MKRKQQAKVRGTARVKKFNADQDEATEDPVEVIEHEFELTPEQLDEVVSGRSRVEIINGEPQLKQRGDTPQAK